MYLFRPIAEADLPALVNLAKSVQGGELTPPVDEEWLSDRIGDSLRSFSPRVKKSGGDYYLFILEDTATHEIAGISGIAARAGGHGPFFSYEIRPEPFSHAPLGIEREIGTLHLKQVQPGPTEIGALYLRADQRRGGLGRLLSLARFLFIGAYPKRFDTTVIAELRGYIDQRGRSPFWEAVGQHFFGRDFFVADQFFGLGNKQFVADLRPRHPLYLPLLPPEVQAVIGKVHHEAQPALALLQAEGFKETKEIDIFDAGPQVRSPVNEIRTIRQSRTAIAREFLPAVPAEPCYLIATPRLDFRAVLGGLLERDGEVFPDERTAEALRIKAGDKVVVAPLR